MGAKLGKFWNKDLFVAEAKKRHGNKFNYDKTEPKGACSKVIVNCPVHGDYEVTANGHLLYDCYECNPRKKKDLKTFLECAREKHGSKYDYSLVDYKRTDKKVKIVCEKHGIFEQTPSSHLEYGCAKCGHDKKLNSTETFIDKAVKLHGDRYDYSLVNYTGARECVKIICKFHGEFEQEARVHLMGCHCQKCANEMLSDSIKHTLNSFIERSKQHHGERYDYSLVDYKHSCVPVKIICSVHGIFKQNPKEHMYGNGCTKCAREKNKDVCRKDNDYFINKAKLRHGDLYDYSLVEYTKATMKVKIICKTHGVFEQRPTDHYISGCPTCNHISTYSKSSYVDNANKNHSGKSTLYFIQVFDDVENFYKVGITVHGTNKRFRNFNSMPYDFHILYTVTDDANRIWDLEKHLFSKFRSYSYSPMCYFGGSILECFKFDVEQEFEVISEIGSYLQSKKENI